MAQCGLLRDSEATARTLYRARAAAWRAFKFPPSRLPDRGSGPGPTRNSLLLAAIAGRRPGVTTSLARQPAVSAFGGRPEPRIIEFLRLAVPASESDGTGRPHVPFFYLRAEARNNAPCYIGKARFVLRAELGRGASSRQCVTAFRAGCMSRAGKRENFYTCSGEYATSESTGLDNSLDGSVRVVKPGRGNSLVRIHHCNSTPPGEEGRGDGPPSVCSDGPPLSDGAPPYQAVSAYSYPGSDIWRENAPVTLPDQVVGIGPCVSPPSDATDVENGQSSQKDKEGKNGRGFDREPAILATSSHRSVLNASQCRNMFWP